MTSANPFDVTKAVDFTDAEIARTFVDTRHDSGFKAILDPRSPTAKYLVGGKGGGRTHLMRHLSYPIQVLNEEDKFAKIQRDGYLGVYFRCSGLNSNRFSGRGISDEKWSLVFSYYMDLWILRLVVETLRDVAGSKDSPWSSDIEASIVQQIVGLFDDVPGEGLSARTLTELAELLSSTIRTIDRAVNNLVFTSSLVVEVRASAGVLLSGVSRVLRTPGTGLENVRLTFLADELENLTSSQQRYLNTLIREKEVYSGFIVGSRRFGLRTFETFSAGEENRLGSEYEMTIIEDWHSRDKKAFSGFCKSLAASRLRAAGFEVDESRVGSFFEIGPDAVESDSMVEGTDWYQKLLATPSSERPHFKRLVEALEAAGHDVNFCMAAVEGISSPSSPLIEKIRLLKVYQSWSKNQGISLEAVASAVDQLGDLVQGDASETALTFYKHHRNDMLAQMCVENSESVPYYGFSAFVEMSGYLPRNFVMILKNVTKWAVFLGESPFASGTSMSRRAQTEGVLEASRWFLTDCQPPGEDGELVGRAVRRLGLFLRRMRYADKPAEVDCSTFSCDRGSGSAEAIRILRMCVDYNILVSIPGGQRDRNSRTLQDKYQLNPMLAPQFGLSTARRGTVSLSGAEVSEIFGKNVDQSGSMHHLNRRVERLTAPFGSVPSEQGALF